jgi:hypothetical protein
MNPTRRAILESVQRVRDGLEPHRHAPFARHMLRIPESDFYALLRLYPHLANWKDPQARQAEWDRFERSAFSEPYRVGRIVRGVVKNGLIGVPKE